MTDYSALREEAAHAVEYHDTYITVAAEKMVAILDELESLRPKAKPAAQKRNQYPIEFEAAWNAYPSERRGTKITAHRAWLARVNSGIDPRSMADGLQKYLQHAKQTGKEVRFMLLLQTFLGPDEHFNTDWTVTAAMRKGAGSGQIGEQDYGAGINADGSF